MKCTMFNKKLRYKLDKPFFIVRIVQLFILIVSVFSISGCNVINPKEAVPTYIHVDSFRFTPANYELQGASTHDIRTVFAFYNNNPIGVFDLPATFPVIATGTGKLE